MDHSCEPPLWTTRETPEFADHQLRAVEDSRSELSLIFIIELHIEFHEDASDIALRVLNLQEIKKSLFSGYRHSPFIQLTLVHSL